MQMIIIASKLGRYIFVGFEAEYMKECKWKDWYLNVRKVPENILSRDKYERNFRYFLELFKNISFTLKNKS